MAVELDEGTVEDLLAAADRPRFEAVRGLVVAVEVGRRAAAVAVGGVTFRVC